MIMLLDLWNLLTIISEVVDSLVDSVQEEIVPFSSFVLIFLFGVVIYFTWVSTNIPDLPPPPRPPYVIQIQANFTPGNGVRENLARHSISDVRLLSSGPLVDSVLHRLPQRSHHQTQHHQHTHGRRSALFFGLLRRPSARPLLHFRPNSGRSRFQASNLIVYHQVNVYHANFRQTNQLQNRVSGEGQENLEVNPASDASPEVSSSVFNSSPLSQGIQLSQERENSFPVLDANSVDEVNVDHRINGNRVNLVQVDIDSSGVTSASQVGVGVDFNGDVTIVEQNLPPASPAQLEELVNSNLVTSNMNRGYNAGPKNDSVPAEASGPSATDVRITLKFLNDTQLEVTTQLSEKIADFKRRHFASEISENKTIRLIFNGRVLDNDGKTLQEAGIFDQCVVHCLIVTPQVNQHRSHATSQNDRREGRQHHPESGNSPREGLEPGMFFVSILGILLIFLWFTCFHFGQQLFTQSAVVSLVVLTAVFVIGLVALYLPVQSNT